MFVDIVLYSPRVHTLSITYTNDKLQTNFFSLLESVVSVAFVKALILVIHDLIIIGNVVFFVVLFVAHIVAFVQFLVRCKLPGVPTQMAAAMHRQERRWPVDEKQPQCAPGTIASRPMADC